MPTYEYKCSICNKKFDIFHGIMEDSIKKCPECGNSVKRLISGGAGFIMKGQNSLACGRESACCGMEGSCERFGECH